MITQISEKLKITSKEKSLALAWTIESRCRNKDGEFSLVIKWGCHCAHTNENSENGNQKATSEFGVSLDINHAQSFGCEILF